MKRTSIWVALVVVAIAAASGGYWLGRMRAPMPAATAQADTSATQPGRKILYWHDPMVPQHKFDKPGKSPFMDMQLVPVYADEASTDGTVAVPSRMAQSLGLRTAMAEETALARSLRTVGSIRPDERRIVSVQARAAGWVEKLNVRAVNDPVRAGQTLAEIYSPELYNAQLDYQLARKFAAEREQDATLAEAARTRLMALGLPADALRALDAGAAPQRRYAIHAPAGGVVLELGVREGQAVNVGMPLYTLVDLSGVWLTAEIPEAEAAWIRQGVMAEAAVASLPGKIFRGRVEYVYPEVDATTRTLRARLALANPRGELKPGMYAEVTLADGARRVLTVPTEAVIRTGTRKVVIVAESEGRFRPLDVETGIEHDGRTEILRGLAAGAKVVSSGQFLIDSEASLRGALARLEGTQSASAASSGTPSASAAPSGTQGANAAQPGTHKGRGKLTKVDAANGRVEIAHEPMPGMQWPAMTMGFKVEDKAQLGALKRGEMVEFELRGEPVGDDYVITRVQPLVAGAAK